MAGNEFWHCTPCKLYALMDIYTELHGGDKKEKPKMGFIDEVL